MKKPEMILFDYGNTLLYETDTDFLKGERAVFEYICENPQHATPEEVCDFGTKLFEEFRQCRKCGYEFHEWQILKCKYERYGITFSVSMDEVEKIIWTNSSVGKRMPYVEEMLHLLHKQGIRTGVISNIGWSGKALTDRINRLLPENHFEFILASSEYCIRKPHPVLFQIALQKAGLTAEQVWYCGDSIKADVYGAHNVGIFPVLYESKTHEDHPYPDQNEGLSVEFEYLHIGHWRELLNVLE